MTCARHYNIMMQQRLTSGHLLTKPICTKKLQKALPLILLPPWTTVGAINDTFELITVSFKY